MEKVAYGEGLHLLKTDTGSELWRYRYRYNGKEQLLALGNAESMDEAEAKAARDAARKLLDEGINPIHTKRLAKIRKATAHGSDFETVARTWHKKRKPGWTEKHADMVLTRLTTHVFPDIGSMNVSLVDGPTVYSIIEKIEERGNIVMARKVHQYVKAILDTAVAKGLVMYNAAPSVKVLLQKKPQEKHHSFIKLKAMPEFFEKLNEYYGKDDQTAMAIRLTIFTCVRTAELLGARWDEIDFDKKVWTIPAARMKVKTQGDHTVPLNKQALALLKRMPQDGELVFPSPRNGNQGLSNNTMLYALYRIGYHKRATMHGMRSLFSTTMNEAGWESDHIEAQLAHKPVGVRAAYNHAKWMPKRREMMQAWGDIISEASA